MAGRIEQAPLAQAVVASLPENTLPVKERGFWRRFFSQPAAPLQRLYALLTPWPPILILS